MSLYDSAVYSAVQALLFLLMAPLAGAVMIGAAAAVTRPISMDYGEPIVYAHASRIRQREPLYQPIHQPPYTIAAYTPLYYVAAAALQRGFGQGFAPGRVFSLACGVGAALCVAYLAVGRTREIRTAVLAALLFVGLGFPGDVPWLGLYRVDMLGVLLSVASMAVLASGRHRLVIVAAVLAGLAVLTKQTFFAAPVAGTIWLWTVDRRSAIRFALVVALTVGVPSTWLEATSRAYLTNTIGANISPFSASVLWELGREFILTQGVPLLLAAGYVALARPWTTPHGRLLLIYWAACAASLVGIARVGANHNYWIELAGVTAALAARFPGVLGPSFANARRPTAAAVAVVAVTLLVVGTACQARGVVQTTAFHIDELRFSDDYSHFEGLVERVRIAPGQVLAEPLDVLALANRPLLLEPLIYSLRLDTGDWDPAPLVTRICDGQVFMVVLGYSLEDAATMASGDYTVWPKPIVAAIQSSMVLESRPAGRFVYVPRSEATPECGT